MEKTKIIIEIPTMLYHTLKLDGVLGYPRLTEIIRNGTPLPKKHGRLIDADELNKCIVDRITMPYVPINKIQMAPTIIEADTESEE